MDDEQQCLDGSGRYCAECQIVECEENWGWSRSVKPGRRHIKRSQAQERRTAKELGGRCQPGSGSLWGAKGDVKAGRFLVESKTTEKAGYRLTVGAISKAQKEALSQHRDWCIQVDFCVPGGNRIVRVAVVPYHIIEELEEDV